MANYNGIEVQKLASVTSSTQKVATFAGGIQSLIMTSDQDVYINFDEQPATSDNGLLVKGGVTNNQWVLGGNNVQKVNVIASSTTANVYILGTRGKAW